MYTMPVPIHVLRVMADRGIFGQGHTRVSPGDMAGVSRHVPAAGEQGEDCPGQIEM